MLLESWDVLVYTAKSAIVVATPRRAPADEVLTWRYACVLLWIYARRHV